MATKLILDTDIGSDIDDAVCLAYLLAQPRCELLGVTTVTGQPETRAMLASALCKAAGKEIPVYPGCADPILVPQRQRDVPQAGALEKWPHETAFPKGGAVEFLRKTIRANPGEVVLLAVGPLTNVGLLFAADPQTASLLKGLVLMCGLFGPPPAEGWPPVEWNAGGDPHATAIVYRAAVRTHRTVSLDVTMRVRMEADEARRRFRHPLLMPVLDMHQHWFGGKGTVIFHDPLAAAVIFDEEICGFERGRVEAEAADPECLGRTRWAPSPDGPHEAAMRVNPERFFEEYFSVF